MLQLMKVVVVSAALSAGIGAASEVQVHADQAASGQISAIWARSASRADLQAKLKHCDSDHPDSRVEISLSV